MKHNGFASVIGQTIDFDYSGNDVCFYSIGGNRPISEFIAAYMEYIHGAISCESCRNTSESISQFSIYGALLTDSTQGICDDELIEIIHYQLLIPYDLCTMQASSYMLSLCPELCVSSGGIIAVQMLHEQFLHINQKIEDTAASLINKPGHTLHSPNGYMRGVYVNCCSPDQYHFYDMDRSTESVGRPQDWNSIWTRLEGNCILGISLVERKTSDVTNNT